MNFEPLMFHSAPKGGSFLDTVDCDVDPWVAAPLVQEPGETHGAETLRRVQSTSAIPFQLNGEGTSMHRWTTGARDTSAGPLPIRSTRLAHPEDISSLESSQSFLAGGHASSFTEDSGMHYFPGGNAPLYPQDALAAVEFVFPSSAPAAAPVRIPAQGGHWAWVPESNNAQTNTNSVPINTGTLPLPSSLPSSAPTTYIHHHHMVPVNAGALPLPVPITTTTRYADNSAPDLDLDLDIGFLDSFDVMEMADTLAPGHLMPMSRPMNMVSRRAIGSCPLPTLLEDTLSAEDDGSNDNMRNGMPSSPSLERCGSATVTTSGSRGSGGSGGGVTGRNSFIPIPGARSMPLKLQRNPRSASQPHLPSILGSSYPSSSDRPMRTAARRSLVVTAAALRETMEDSDSEDFSEDGLPVSGTVHVRRNSTGGNHHNHTASTHNHRQSHGSSASAAKKKHNPWSLEETLALVEGVRLAGVGKWAEIKRLPVPAVADMLETRTPVDLKDKWRNLTRVARLPKAALRQRLQRGPSDVPLETMLTVKHLMEIGQDQE